VVDADSSDGSWEIANANSARDKRIHVRRGKVGLYHTWNDGLKDCQGSYVYVATSDDTMEPDCLEKMVEAMETHPECGLCSCLAKVIDRDGNEIMGMSDPWNQRPYFGCWLEKRHVRRAPHDGFLHWGIGTVHGSITQVLVRKSVYEKAGLFRSEWGVAGDFEWGMRVTLQNDVLFLPEYLATWRKHESNPTQFSISARDVQKQIEMARVAWGTALHRDRSLQKKYKVSPFSRMLEKQWLRMSLGECQNKAARASLLAEGLLKYPLAVLETVQEKCVGREKVSHNEEARKRMEMAGLVGCLQAV